MVRDRLQHGDYELIIRQATSTAVLVSKPDLERDLGRELSQTEYERLERLFLDILPEVYPMEMWVSPMATVYAKFFTVEEIESMQKFDQTPAGRKLLNLQVTVAREMEPLITSIIEEKQEEIEARIVAENERAPIITGGNSQTRVQDSKALRISEVIDVCGEIQAARDVPITCTFDYLDGNPAIVVGFPNGDLFASLWEVVVDGVGVPFCNAANEANRQGFLLVGLVREKQARAYSCETSEWSDWFTIDPGSEL